MSDGLRRDKLRNIPTRPKKVAAIKPAFREPAASNVPRSRRDQPDRAAVHLQEKKTLAAPNKLPRNLAQENRGQASDQVPRPLDFESTSTASPSAKRKTILQFPETRTLQSPRRPPCNRCRRYPGRSISVGKNATSRSIRMRRMRRTFAAQTPSCVKEQFCNPSASDVFARG